VTPLITPAKMWESVRETLTAIVIVVVITLLLRLRSCCGANRTIKLSFGRERRAGDRMIGPTWEFWHFLTTQKTPLLRIYFSFFVRLIRELLGKMLIKRGGGERRLPGQREVLNHFRLGGSQAAAFHADHFLLVSLRRIGECVCVRVADCNYEDNRTNTGALFVRWNTHTLINVSVLLKPH